MKASTWMGAEFNGLALEGEEPKANSQ